ncbi:MAG: DotU family type IV/VI secretion system protein [Pirellulaceae bacterium]
MSIQFSNAHGDCASCLPIGHAEHLDGGRSEIKELLSRVHSSELAAGLSSTGDYLGICYPLACWIDEMMTSDPVAGSVWNENKLEGELFGTNDRAWMFWRQAQLAETQNRREALTVFYLCVGLGFTGQYRNDPEKLAAWMHRTRLALGLVTELKLPFANDLAPGTDVPPLTGSSKLRTAGYVGWLSAVVLLPFLSYLAVATWNR